MGRGHLAELAGEVGLDLGTQVLIGEEEHEVVRQGRPHLGHHGVVHVADYLVHEREAPTSGAIEAVLEEGFLDSRGLSHRLEAWKAALSNLTQEQAAQ